jgi:hypothetical protein
MVFANVCFNKLPINVGLVLISHETVSFTEVIEAKGFELFIIVFRMEGDKVNVRLFIKFTLLT